MSEKFEIVQPKKEELKEEVKKKPHNYFFDFIKDLSQKKQYILNEDNQKDYVPYLINKFLSMHQSTILYAQEMNIRHQIEKDMHYDYLFESLRPMNRYFKYHKSNKKSDDLLLLSDYYQCSLIKAKEYLNIHDESDLDMIRSKMNKGGEDVKTRKRKNKS